jgi:hypothetical protein
MANPIDNTIQKAESAVTQAKDPDLSTIWKLALGAIIGLVVWYLRWKLGSQAQELAELKTKQEQAVIDAKAAQDRASVAALDSAGIRAKSDAIMQTTAAAMLEHQVQELEKTHAAQVAKVDAIDNWKDLNKEAGVR